MKLKDVGKIVSGGTPKTKIPEYWNGNISWITPADLSGYSEIYIKRGKKSITKTGLDASSAKLMPKGSVLFSSRAPIGYVVVASEEVATNQGFKSVVPDQNLVSEYLYYYLKSIKPLAESRASGTTFKEISKKVFAELPIPIPPLPEQRAIVAKLERLFAELDRSVAELETAREKLKVYRQSVLKEAFSSYQDGVPIDSIADVKGGFAFKSKTFLKDHGEYQVIKIGNIKPGRLELLKSPAYLNRVSNQLIRKAGLLQGDVLVTLTGTKGQRDYGWTAIVNKDNLLLNQRVAALRFNKSEYDPKFFLYYSWTRHFRDRFFETETGNTGQGNVGMKSVRKTLIPLPSIKEQIDVVQEIESRFSVADRLERDITESLERAKGLRQGLLKRAFAGELV
ncbi:restriction endonuclease subunit S [Lewinella sp. JB7]|nr:restriction endonuclease subunit S [Lewinella sp. JB7]